MYENKTDSSIKIIFILSIFVAIISSVSIVFPALILGIFEDIPKYPEKIEIFEKGVLFYPFFLVNISSSIIAILYLKDKFPYEIKNVFQKLSKFDISKRQALSIVLIMIDVYAMFALQEVWTEDTWEDYNRTVKPRLENFSFEDILQPDGIPVSFLLGKTSMIIFGSYRVIPLIFSTALLFLTYWITIKITKKEISGIISMSVVLSSAVFQTYDTTITYPNFWIVFYLLSLIVMYRFWPLSPALFGIAIMAKPLPFLFLPMTFFFIYSIKISKRKKHFISLSYLGLIAVIVSNYILSKNEIVFNYDNHEFWSGFSTIATQFRFEPIITLSLIPIIIWMFIFSKKEKKKTMLVMFLITYMLLLAPIISGFTTYTNNVHRFIPLIIFFGVSIGLLFSIQPSNLSTVQRIDAVSPG